MFCPDCGTRNEDNSQYCKRCGHALEPVVPARLDEVEYDRALPDNEQVPALIERAWRQRKTGDMAGATATIEEAIRLHPDSTTAHSFRGQLAEELGDRARAVTEYEHVLRLNPGSIADRVKLDQLRDGQGMRTPGSGPASPAAPSDSRLGMWLLGAVAVCALAGVMVLALRHTGPTVLPPDAVHVPKTTQQDSGAKPAQQQVAANNGAAPFGTLPQPVTPPTVVYRDVPVPVRTDPGAGAARTQPPANGTSTARVHMPPDDNGSNYVIKVSPADSGGAGGGNNSITVNPPTPAGGSGGSPAPTDANGATSDALGFISSGNESYNRGNYSQAIAFYRRALAGAGDEAPVVNQQIAQCYMDQKNYTTSRTYYAAAIDGFKKLDTAGRLTDSGRSRMNVCQKGIALCDSQGH